MYGWILTSLVAYGGSIAALRYPLIGLNVYIGLAVLRPQFIFSFAGDLAGLSQIVGFATIAGWAGRGFGSWKFGRARGVVVAFTLFIVWMVTSATLALETDRAFGLVTAMAKVFVPFLVGATLMKEEKEWRHTFWTIVLCQGYVAYEMNSSYLGGYNRAADGFGGMDNNCFGVSLVTVLGPALSLMMSSRTWKTKALAGLCAAMILHATLLTYSRGAMIGLLAVGFVIFVMMPKRPKYLAAMAVVGLLTLRFMGPELLARYGSTFASDEQRDSSAESRLDLWRDCLNVANRYPVFGVGPANWRVIASSYGWSQGKSAHSVWMETAAEVGYAGAAILLMTFVLAGLRLAPLARAKLAKAGDQQFVYASGIILAVVGFVVSGQFVSVSGLEAPYYFVMLGVALVKNAQADETAGTLEKSRIPPPIHRPTFGRFQAPQPAAGVRSSAFQA